jgi:uncharacterized protein YukE
MSGFEVEPGGLAAKASTVDTAAGRVDAEAAKIRGQRVSELPPETGAALDAALDEWPAALRRLSAVLRRTGSALREGGSAYHGTDQSAADAAAGRPQ